nr:transposase, MuDR, MULE transposase domain protein [Tanacetum cinerariifolium]
MNNLQAIQSDAYHKLCEVGLQRWSRAHCPLVRYNYLTLNSVEPVNACTVLYRKLPVLKLAKTYRAMVQDWRRIPNIVEPELRTIAEIIPMADRTMEELLQAPMEGYGEAIVIPKILAEDFEIKTNLL